MKRQKSAWEESNHLTVSNLPSAVHEALYNEAKSTNRSISGLVRQILTDRYATKQEAAA